MRCLAIKTKVDKSLAVSRFLNEIWLLKIFLFLLFSEITSERCLTEFGRGPREILECLALDTWIELVARLVLKQVFYINKK